MTRSRVFPLTQTIQVTGVPSVVRDRFGNEHPVPGEPVDVKVFGWAVNQTDEKTDESVLRTIDLVDVYMPPESAPGPEARLFLSDGSEWEVVGHAEQYSANPWFDPGLVVVHARKVGG